MARVPRGRRRAREHPHRRPLRDDARLPLSLDLERERDRRALLRRRQQRQRGRVQRRRWRHPAGVPGGPRRERAANGEDARECGAAPADPHDQLSARPLRHAGRRSSPGAPTTSSSRIRARTRERTGCPSTPWSVTERAWRRRRSTLAGGVLLGDSTDGGATPSNWRARAQGSGENYLPIIDIVGAGDGQHVGLGYMESWVSNPKPIDSSAAVRELFTYRGKGAARVLEALVRVRRTGDQVGPLSVRLEDPDGKALAVASVPGALVPSDGPGWVKATFPKPPLLREGPEARAGAALGRRHLRGVPATQGARFRLRPTRPSSAPAMRSSRATGLGRMGSVGPPEPPRRRPAVRAAPALLSRTRREASRSRPRLALNVHRRLGLPCGEGV